MLHPGRVVKRSLHSAGLPQEAAEVVKVVMEPAVPMLLGVAAAVGEVVPAMAPRGFPQDWRSRQEAAFRSR